MSLFLPIVPPFFSIFLAMLILLLLARRHAMLFSVGVGAICFMASLSWQYQQRQLAAAALLAPGTTLMQVVITSPPITYPEYTQLNATVQSGPARGYKVKLRWQQPPALAAGQHWRLQARLKPIHGYANPGSVNATAQALVSGLVAEGHVTRGPHILLAQQQLWRQQLVARLDSAIAPYASAPLLKALAVGERAFSRQLWRGAQHAGLGHLLAISGLHVGLVFGWVLWLSGCSKGLIAIRRQQLLALLAALTAALLYAWLADFAIPTLRASIALTMLVVCRSQLTRLSPNRFWLLLVAMLLLLQPFWVLSTSFWLSVLAVAIIFFVLWRFPLSGLHWQARIKYFFVFHLVLSLLMTLLGSMLFGGFSPLMLLSNLLFVPWCSLVAIPLLLVSLLLTLSGLDASWLWQLTDVAFRPLLYWLIYSADLPLWWPLGQASALLMALLALLVTIALLVQRNAMLLLPLSLVLLSGSALQPPRWQLHVLDSGQRQLVLLQQGKRALLLDAAPALAQQDLNDTVLSPVLRRLGISQLDYLLFRQQRPDRNRHWTLLTDYPVAAQNLQAFSEQAGAASCQNLPAAYYDVRIEVLLSDNRVLNNKPDHCILRFTLGRWRVLLPGIITPAIERELLAGDIELAADIMLLANNGSAAVNSLALLQQVRPVLALNSAAFMNGYGHPAQAVQQRLALLAVPLLNTADYGAITLGFDDHELQISSWRDQILPLWLEKPPAIAETLTTTR
ncbi:DNA internalization-related competence protein ComEC/Rec2 [Arsukibacterium ikkense]|uniref:DNA internalization-related competence protein ComEC/Rec2 n=1 Tax=Arsukibacterium ikkense TaxID=336831 RepID=UPI00069A2FDC|nr:DNA internalization-related competence protein ComEC/Rec2 [Arsukibacterium ikkense]